MCLFLSTPFLAETSHILRVPKFETSALVVVEPPCVFICRCAVGGAGEGTGPGGADGLIWLGPLFLFGS